MKNNTGRGYVVRFLEEKTNTAHFYTDIGALNRRNDPWTETFVLARVFLTHKEAENTIVESKKIVSKVYGKGYMYIAKIFYKTGVRDRLFPTKLTKIDKHDFLQAI
jgi:hypothetical protein